MKKIVDRARYEDDPIRIVFSQTVFTRGVRVPFRDLYCIKHSGEFREIPGSGVVEIDYEGTPVGSLRRIAARLGREQGRPVVDETKRRR